MDPNKITEAERAEELRLERAAERAADAAAELDAAHKRNAERKAKKEELRKNKAKLAEGQELLRMAIRDAVDAGVYFPLRELAEATVELSRIRFAEVSIRPDSDAVGIIMEELTKDGTPVYRHYTVKPDGTKVRNGLPALGGKGKAGKADEVFDD